MVMTMTQEMITSFSGEWSFLSNFFEFPMVIRLETLKVPGLFGRMEVPTVEHPFQAAKSVFLNEVYGVLNQETPGQAKRAGRRVQLRTDWEHVKRGIMWKLLNAKFVGTELEDQLLSTGDAILI